MLIAKQREPEPWGRAKAIKMETGVSLKKEWTPGVFISLRTVQPNNSEKYKTGFCTILKIQSMFVTGELTRLCSFW